MIFLADFTFIYLLLRTFRISDKKHLDSSSLIDIIIFSLFPDLYYLPYPYPSYSSALVIAWSLRSLDSGVTLLF